MKRKCKKYKNTKKLKIKFNKKYQNKLLTYPNLWHKSLLRLLKDNHKLKEYNLKRMGIKKRLLKIIQSIMLKRKNLSKLMILSLLTAQVSKNPKKKYKQQLINFPRRRNIL